MLLRRDTGPLGALRPYPPTPEAPARDPKSVDSAGAGQVMEAVRNTETLLEALAAEPAPVLQDRRSRASATSSGWPAPPTWTRPRPRCFWRSRTRPA